MARVAGRTLPPLMVAVLTITSLPSLAPGALTMAERLTEAMARSLHVSRERALGFEKRQGRLTEIGNRLPRGSRPEDPRAGTWTVRRTW